MTKYIYINAAKEKFPVSDEEYRTFTRETDAKRKREQYHQRCYCPKEFIWQCDGDCDICRFHRAGDMCSLDYPNDEGGTLLDSTADETDMEQIVCDAILLKKLIAKLCELDPDGEKMVAIWQDNPDASDREVARQLGRKQRTFANHMKKNREILKSFAQIES